MCVRLKRWGRWCALLGTSQEKGMSQERDREKHQATRKEPKQTNAIL
jgi:hypothetical protein